MLHTQTILNTFLSNYMHIQVTWIQLGIAEIWWSKATHPPSLRTAPDTSRRLIPTFPFWECGLRAVHW